MDKKIKQVCPQIPIYGAVYPDGACIDGLMYDLDKCDDNGNLYGEGEIPCPFCNTEEYINYYEEELEPGNENMTEEDYKENREVREEIREGVKKLKEKHGYKED